MFQLGLFDKNLCEVVDNGVRYILKRNPCRAEEMAESRTSKLYVLKTLADQQNQYLAQHPKAEQHTAWKKVREKMERLHLGSFVTVTARDRHVNVEVDEEYLSEVAELDGCYALKTDLSRETATKETVHDRYKDLAMVENAFRTSKTAHLEVRPVYVRTEANTRGHVLVVMLSYLIVRALKSARVALDLTVEEGLDSLKRICATRIKLKSGGTCLRVPQPDLTNQRLLSAMGIQLLPALPDSSVKVATKRKLPARRKS